MDFFRQAEMISRLDIAETVLESFLIHSGALRSGERPKQLTLHTIEKRRRDYEYSVKLFNSFVENRVEMPR